MPEDRSNAEQDLLQAAAAGDKQAFGILYDMYYKLIFRYSFYRLGETADAEDMAESVFLKLWENLPGQTRSGGIQNVRAWLYRVAHNLIIDFYRSRKKEQSFDPFENSIQGGSSTHDVMENRHVTGELFRTIRQLDEKSQQVIILRFVEGLSHKETADVVGISEGHVRIIQFRALKKMKDLLGDENE